MDVLTSRPTVASASGPAPTGEGRRAAALWAIGVSGVGWALGLVGVLVPLLSSDLLAFENPAIAIIAGAFMLLLNIVSLVIAVIGVRRPRGSAKVSVATPLSLVLSIIGLLVGLGVVGFGAVLIFAWAMVNAAAVSL